MTEHLIRHGDYLTVVVINDPVYLTEPFMRTTNFVWDPQQQIAPYPCQAVVEVERPQGTVPHHLPGTNEFLEELPGDVQHAGRGHPRRSGNDVSRVHGETEEDEGADGRK